MDHRVVARLVMVTAAASGAIAFAFQLDTGTDTAARAGAAGTTLTTSSAANPATGRDSAPAVSARSRLQHALRASAASSLPASLPAARRAATDGVDESAPHVHTVVPRHTVDPDEGGPVPASSMRGVLEDVGRLGPLHIDPMPRGRSIDDPIDTRTLLERADLAASVAADPGPITAGASAPVGTPSIPTLSSHVTPSCSGTGTDGNRVQVLYVHETTKQSRYSTLLPALRNEVANVDDVFALSAQQTGGERRVRWVHDANCLPVIKDVTVPAGSLGTDFNATITAIRNLGYDKPSRKYLMFADANALCGIGSVYDDASPTDNPNDGTYPSYSRVDAGCWTTDDHSVAAHELTHNLGGVLGVAPHATSRGHCFDESDLMCYPDGSGVPMQNFCATAQERLLDCRHDDYFSTNPPAGSFLAKNWNTARSSFLDRVVTPLPPPDVAVSASAASTLTGRSVRFTATSSQTVSWTWTRSHTACSLTPRTSGQADLVCPSTVSGTVTVTATATRTGASATGSGQANVTVTKAPAPTAALSAPADAVAGQPFPVSVTPTGVAPFTYAWTAPGCTVGTPTAASATVTCPGGSTARDVPVGVVVTQADGQSVASSATVRVPAGATTPTTTPTPTPTPSPTPGPTATSWSTPTWGSSTVSARLRDSSGAALPGRPVTLQVRWAGTSTWRAALRLTTDATGRAAVRVSTSSAGWFRFVTAGDTSHAGSVSAAVYVKVTTSLRMTTSGSRLVGTLRTSEGSPVAGAPVLLQRRLPSSPRWATVVRLRTSAQGRASARVDPPRRTYYRWSYAGEATHLRAYSRLMVRR